MTLVLHRYQQALADGAPIILTGEKVGQRCNYTMQYPFNRWAMFTDVRFFDNSIVVMTYITVLSGERMQEIGSGFKFSGSTFVLRCHVGHTRTDRVYTPT
jgi:hypothetical protein